MASTRWMSSTRRDNVWKVCGFHRHRVFVLDMKWSKKEWQKPSDRQSGNWWNVARRLPERMQWRNNQFFELSCAIASQLITHFNALFILSNFPRQICQCFQHFCEICLWCVRWAHSKVLTWPRLTMSTKRHHDREKKGRGEKKRSRQTKRCYQVCSFAIICSQ